jgi:uncharacterized membrane protein YbhN (UPF0104 family)
MRSREVAGVSAAQAWWRKWGTPVKVVAIAAVLAILFWRLSKNPDIAHFGEAWKSTLAAVLVAHFAFFLMALRWKWSMNAVGVPFTTGASWAVTAQSYFYYHVTPLAIGADVARFAKALALAPQKPRFVVIFAVLFDRMLGMASLAIVFAATAPFVFHDLSLPVITPAIGIIIACGVIACAALGLAGCWILRRRLAQFIATGLPILRQGAPYFALTLVAATAMQVAYGIGLWIGAVGWRIEISPLESICAAAGSLFFNLVPASVFGIGVGQVAGVAIYLALGLSQSEALLLILLGYLAHFSLGILGGVAEMAGLDRRLSRGFSAE